MHRVVVTMYPLLGVVNVIANAKAIAPRNPANQMTTCIFMGIFFFRLMLAQALNGNVFNARAPAQNNIDKIINEKLHLCSELKTEVPMYAKTMVSLMDAIVSKTNEEDT